VFPQLAELVHNPETAMAALQDSPEVAEKWSLLWGQESHSSVGIYYSAKYIHSISNSQLSVYM